MIAGAACTITAQLPIRKCNALVTTACSSVHEECIKKRMNIERSADLAVLAASSAFRFFPSSFLSIIPYNTDSKHS